MNTIFFHLATHILASPFGWAGRDAFIKDAALPAKGDRVVYWDTAMPSFGLMVTKSSARSFVYQYRNALHQGRR
jgi:hypothetical protein